MPAMDCFVALFALLAMTNLGNRIEVSNSIH
jgi:hypothetical protein